MDSPSAPPAPDYQGAAAATAAGNLQNLNAQTWANRPTQVTPNGSTNWSTSIDTQAYDRALADWTASGADPTTRPTQNSYTRWTQTLSLTPASQAALNDQQAIQANQSDLAMTLQGQVANTMRDGLDLPSLSSYTNGVPNVRTNFAGFNPTGVGGVNQQAFNPNSFTAGVQGVNQNFAGGPSQDTSLTSRGANLNLNAPQFSTENAQAGAKAAYDANTELLKDQWEQDTSGLDAKLRMQGLTPGSEAYNNAMQNLSRTQAQQQNQIANQSVITGNDMANQNYASALSGYRAGNDARGQQFGQDATTFNAENAARATQFGQNATQFGLTNDARTQALDNSLARYGATLQGQDAYNTSQNQAYTQALAGYGANTSAQQASNDASGQALQRALQLYGAAQNDAYTRYTTPLNMMNAVLNGQQVQNPTMPSFATAGYTGGPDMMGATQALGSWNQGIYNAQAANASSMNGMLGSLGAAGLMFMSDARLKRDIVKVGTTKGGNNWYRWTWKNTGKVGYGVIAQELLLKQPEAVAVANDGHYAVNYALVA